MKLGKALLRLNYDIKSRISITVNDSQINLSRLATDKYINLTRLVNDSYTTYATTKDRRFTPNTERRKDKTQKIGLK